MKSLVSVNYKGIYRDLITKKFPEKLPEFQYFFNKESLTELDVLQISKRLSVANKISTQKYQHKAYSKSTILKILDYQKKNRLSNSQLANHFEISRNTVTKWKKIFL